MNRTCFILDAPQSMQQTAQNICKNDFLWVNWVRFVGISLPSTLDCSFHVLLPLKILQFNAEIYQLSDIKLCKTMSMHLILYRNSAISEKENSNRFQEHWINWQEKNVWNTHQAALYTHSSRNSFQHTDALLQTTGPCVQSVMSAKSVRFATVIYHFCG